ncbi:MAG: SLBB domain-containing protein [Candidatus Eisenbacteria bacterium]
MDRSSPGCRSILTPFLISLLLISSAAGAYESRAFEGRADGSRDDDVADVTEAQTPAPGPVFLAPVVSALRGPIDEKTYIVGPGDGFSITVWGQGVASHLAKVTPEGELVIPGVATVPVAGKLLMDAKADVAKSLESFYHDVEVSVSLVDLRSMLINVLGGVMNPGGYIGTALDPAGELVLKAGGLLPGASSRNITITRLNGQRHRVDLERYRNTGDVTSNPPILDGDVIFVPHAVEFVDIAGAVAAPDRYERVDGETVGSLIELAGGFARGAVTDSVEVRQFVGPVETRSFLVDAMSREGAGTSLADGDQVYVRELNEWRRPTMVEIEGEVGHPGPYGITEGTDWLSDVIRRAGGPTKEASLADARLIRPPPSGGPDIEFGRLEEMPINEMTELEYDYFRTRATDRHAVVVDFVRALSGDRSEDVPVLGGDIIVVPKMTRTVEVIGQVADPGEVDYEPGKRYGYYIAKAGGYGPVARKGRVRVIVEATGEWTYAGRAGVLAPGDVVWVPERAETDWWKFVREATSVVASLVTVYIVVDQATAN